MRCFSSKFSHCKLSAIKDSTILLQYSFDFSKEKDVKLKQIITILTELT
jgi:hypothetical protein